jgi:hypothetical protein
LPSYHKGPKGFLSSVREAVVMRCFLLAAVALFPALALAADAPGSAAPAKAGQLAPGKDLPGPFHPFCVSGPYIAKLQQASEKDRVQGRFHCPISAHGLDPMVLLFVQGLNFTEPLKDLLVRLDAAIEKNPNVRLGAAVVFLSNDLPDVVTMDDKRDELAEQLRSLASALKLKNVSLCLDSKSDLEKYGLDKEEAYTIVLVRRYAVVTLEAIPRDSLTADKVAQVMAQVGQKLGATRQ